MYLRHINFKGAPGPARATDAQFKAAADAAVEQIHPAPITGSMHDHDDLAQALATYEASVCLDNLRAIRPVALRCGMPEGSTVLSWSRGRVARYGQMMRGEI